MWVALTAVQRVVCWADLLDNATVEMKAYRMVVPSVVRTVDYWEIP